MKHADESVRQALPTVILEELFGLKQGVNKLTLWEKINLIGLLAKEVSLSPNSLAELIKGKAKKVKTLVKPNPWASPDMENLHGSELQLLKLADIVKAQVERVRFINQCARPELARTHVGSYEKILEST